MKVLVAGDHCYLRDTRGLLLAGILDEMFGQNAGRPVTDALAAARG
jgi:hypothetical protein